MQTKVIENGIEIDKTDFGGAMSAHAPIGSYFSNSGLHTIGYAGATMKEVRKAIKEDGPLAKCPTDCDGDEHEL